MVEKFKLLFRSIFRYKLIAVFFIISQLVVYSAVFGALSIYNRAYDKQLDKMDGTYKNRISMEVVTISDRDIFTYAGLDVNDGNLVIAGKLSLALLESGSKNRAEIILKANEAFLYPMISGRLPGSKPEDEGKKLIALGRDKYRYAYEKDGKMYVTIESETYEVVGVIGSERSDYWDYKIVMNVACIGEYVREAIVNRGSYTLELSSNTKNLQQSYTEVYSNIHSVDDRAKIESKKVNSMGDNYALKSLETENMKMNILVYVFCIFNCMLMSEFWVIKRRKEIAVRKVCGMSDYQILTGLARDMFGLCIVALVIFIAGAVVWNQVSGAESIVIIPITLIGVTIATLIIIIMSMAYPTYKVMHMNPADALGNGD